MKKLLVIISILFFVNANSQSKVGWLFVNENFIELDKQLHGAAGLYAGTTGYFVAYQLSNENRKTAKIWGIITPIILGSLKEWSDSTKTNGVWGWGDWTYTVGGGIVATYTFDFLTHRAKRRNKNRKK